MSKKKKNANHCKEKGEKQFVCVSFRVWQAKNKNKFLHADFFSLKNHSASGDVGLEGTHLHDALGAFYD